MTAKTSEINRVKRDHAVAIYARVSTAIQDCDRQLDELKAFADRAGFNVVGVFTETASGKANARPERKKILALAQRREIDGVLVTELSRWGRSTQDLLSTLDELAVRGVSVRALNGFEVDLASPTGRVMVTLLAGIAEFEAGLLAERVKSGLSRAKAKGKKLGRKKGVMPVVQRNLAAVRHYVAGGKSQRWIAKELQIDRKTVRKITKLIDESPTTPG